MGQRVGREDREERKWSLCLKCGEDLRDDHVLTIGRGREGKIIELHSARNGVLHRSWRHWRVKIRSAMSDHVEHLGVNYSSVSIVANFSRQRFDVFMSLLGCKAS